MSTGVNIGECENNQPQCRDSQFSGWRGGRYRHRARRACCCFTFLLLINLVIVSYIAHKVSHISKMLDQDNNYAYAPGGDYIAPVYPSEGDVISVPVNNNYNTFCTDFCDSFCTGNDMLDCDTTCSTKCSDKINQAKSAIEVTEESNSEQKGDETKMPKKEHRRGGKGEKGEKSGRGGKGAESSRGNRGNHGIFGF